MGDRRDAKIHTQKVEKSDCSSAKRAADRSTQNINIKKRDAKEDLKGDSSRPARES